MSIPITELLGDGIGSELRDAVRRVAEALPPELEFRSVDLSLENRRKSGHRIYDEAYESILQTRYAIKYPTITEEESPNQVLRKMCNFTVIHRPVTTIKGINRNFTPELDLDIVRVATGGTYEDPGRMIGTEAAVSIRIVEAKVCRSAAFFAFALARSMGKTLTSSSKYTIQRITDGLFEHVVNEVERNFPDVPHSKELFDALLAKIIISPKEFSVILVLNEYGDFLSDMACGLIGSLGIGASGSYSFDSDHRLELAMFDPAGGTAPDIAGKNVANPSASILALSMLLFQLGETDLGKLVRRGVFTLIENGCRTLDMGGDLSTTDFTEEMVKFIDRELAHHQ